MLLAADFGTGQVLWSLVWLCLFVLWAILVVKTVSDILRSDDLSGPGKAVWTLVILVMPYLGVFIYLIVRGTKMSQREVAAMDAEDAAVREYILWAAGQPTTADRLSALADLHAAGKLTDDEYGAAKSGILDT